MQFLRMLVPLSASFDIDTGKKWPTLPEVHDGPYFGALQTRLNSFVLCLSFIAQNPGDRMLHFPISLRLTLMIMYEEVSFRFPTWAGA